MPHQKPLVSIVIPCYNASIFIAATLRSVMKQTYNNIEIICVNDGSTDNTPEVIESIKNDQVVCIHKPNSGVSDTRNKGFDMAKGKYILFLDADDILSKNFIEDRVNYLEQNPGKCFCASIVIKIDEQDKEIPSGNWKGAAENTLAEVLSYRPDILTCPSNYLYRKSFLDENNITFNTELSSSADRYFLVELAALGQGALIPDAPLYYRVHPESMSNNFNMSLLKDNVLFQEKILKRKDIPKKLRNEFCCKTNYIFAGSYYKLRKYPACFWFSVKAFYYSPSIFFRQLRKTPTLCVV